jgi:hypothetical protein
VGAPPGAPAPAAPFPRARSGAGGAGRWSLGTLWSGYRHELWGSGAFRALYARTGADWAARATRLGACRTRRWIPPRIARSAAPPGATTPGGRYSGTLWTRAGGGRTGGGDAMTKRLPATAAPLPLEAYAGRFDDLFAQRSQREGFRRYLAGVLLPAERNQTATGLAKTEPTVGAQHPRAQALPWSLSESTWDPVAVNPRRLALLRADPTPAPDARGVLVIDEHGDRTWGRKTAHVGRQYLANRGKADNGVVSVTSPWADERVYWPVDYEPYTPQHHFAKGRADPAFRTKLQITGELVAATMADGLPFRAVAADSFYGEDAGFRQRLHDLRAGYVLALKPSHTWWHSGGRRRRAVAGGGDGGVARCRVAGGPGRGRAPRPRRARGDVVGARGGGRAVRAGARAARRRRHHRPGDPARPHDLGPRHQPAGGRRRSGRGRAPVRAPGVGGAGPQAHRARTRLVAVPSPQRRGKAPPLAAGLLRVLLLLGAPGPRGRRRGGSARRAGGRATGGRRGGGAGGTCAPRARRAAGRRRCAPSVHGWSRGCCSGAAGAPGRAAHRRARSGGSSSISGAGTDSTAPPRLDPAPQSIVI